MSRPSGPTGGRTLTERGEIDAKRWVRYYAEAQSEARRRADRYRDEGNAKASAYWRDKEVRLARKRALIQETLHRLEGRTRRREERDAWQARRGAPRTGRGAT